VKGVVIAVEVDDQMRFVGCSGELAGQSARMLHWLRHRSCVREPV